MQESLSNIQQYLSSSQVCFDWLSGSIITISIIEIYLGNRRGVWRESHQLDADMIDGSNYHKELHLGLLNGGSVERYTVCENQKKKLSPPHFHMEIFSSVFPLCLYVSRAQKLNLNLKFDNRQHARGAYKATLNFKHSLHISHFSQVTYLHF